MQLASKTFTAYIKGTSEKYGVQAVCTSTANVAGNTSSVTVKVRAIHPYINISSRTGNIKINGKKYSFNSSAIKDSGPTQVASKTVTVAHDDDGTKKIDISVSFPFNLDSSSYGDVGTATASGSLTLDTIPRASSVSVADQTVEVNGENAWHLTVSKNADVFRHKAMLTFGDQSIETEAFDTDISVVIPLEWLQLMPSQMESAVDVSIQTYSDEQCTTTVGDAIFATFTIKVPADAAPDISSGWATVSVYNTGPAEGVSVYVQNYSRAHAVFDHSLITPKYGATIADCKVEWNGMQDPSITPVLTASGDQTLRCTVTDSRGQSRSEEFTVYVHEYYLPTLSDIVIYRSDLYGNELEEGTMIYFKARCRYAECGGENAVNITADWKTVSSPYWTNATMIANDEGSVLGAGRVSVVISYNARIVAIDRFGNQITFATLISTANVALHLRDGGMGGGLGKYGERDGLFDCDWDLLVRGALETEGDATIVGDVEAKNAAFSGDVTGENMQITGSAKAGSIESVGSIKAADAVFGDDAAAAEFKATGASIGMRSTGTESSKKFEVASSHKSYLNGGAYGEGGYRMDKCGKWEYLTISNSNFASYSSEYAPRISRVGALVFLDGMVKNTAELSASFNATVATLPEWARPVTDVHAIQQGSGRAVWWQRITAAGAVIIHRYRDESGYVGAPEVSQFPLSLSWIAADAFEAQ